MHININRTKYSFIKLILNSLLVVSGLLLFSQCKSTMEETAKQSAEIDGSRVSLTDAQLKNAPIETVNLAEKNIVTILKLNGKIDVPPHSLVSVSIPLGGYLKSSELLPGMHVKKGEIIARIEDPQYIRLQQDYLQAKTKLQFAELNYKRQKELNQSRASSDKVMQQAEADMNSHRITMNGLAQQLRLINISPEKLNENNIAESVPVRSQINGFVSKVNVNIGKYVNPTDVLFELIDPSDIHLNLKVFEKDINKLHVDQKLIAYSNAAPEEKYKGEIILISKDVNADGITEVHCHFIDQDQKLLPGTYMNAEIETKTTFSYAIPEECIVSFEAKDYVFVETEKQQYDMMPVTVGEKEKGFVQIINHEDLDGKKIVSKNTYILLMKLKNTSDE